MLMTRHSLRLEQQINSSFNVISLSSQTQTLLGRLDLELPDIDSWLICSRLPFSLLLCISKIINLHTWLIWHQTQRSYITAYPNLWLWNIVLPWRDLPCSLLEAESDASPPHCLTKYGLWLQICAHLGDIPPSDPSPLLRWVMKMLISSEHLTEALTPCLVPGSDSTPLWEKLLLPPSFPKCPCIYVRTNTDIYCVLGCIIDSFNGF